MERVRQQGHLLERHGRIRSSADLAVAALIGLTVIAIAWGAYRAEVGEKDADHYYNRSDETRAKANRHEVQGDQGVAASEQLFLELERDQLEGRRKAAAFLRDQYLTAGFLAAVRWWREQPRATRPATPFVARNPFYRNAHYARAAFLEHLADGYLVRAHHAEERAIDYTVVTVILTCALFMFGIATQVAIRAVSFGLIVVGTLVLLGSFGRFIDLAV